MCTHFTLVLWCNLAIAVRTHAHNHVTSRYEAIMDSCSCLVRPHRQSILDTCKGEFLQTTLSSSSTLQMW